MRELSVAELAAASRADRASAGEIPVSELKVAAKGQSSRRGRTRGRVTKRRLAGGEIVIGKLVGLDSAGVPLVDHPLNASSAPLPSRTTIPLGPERLGHDVVLGFEGGDPDLPIVLGLVYQPDATPGDRCDRPRAEPAEVNVDGERFVFSAEKEIVLRCGDASLTLTRAGKVLIRGKYVLSRSSGVNRIKGGSVQIN
jgi:hypothetical protein